MNSRVYKIERVQRLSNGGKSRRMAVKDWDDPMDIADERLRRRSRSWKNYRKQQFKF